MAKELLWSEEMDSVIGWARDFKNTSDFIDEVKGQYENGPIDVTNVRVQACICTEEGIPGDTIMPLSSTDVVIENFYTARISEIEEECLND